MLLQSALQEIFRGSAGIKGLGSGHCYMGYVDEEMRWIYVQLSLALGPDQHCFSHRAMTLSPKLIPVKGSAGIPPFSLPSEHIRQVSSAGACQIF